jgi:SAM-dependent methyltransferase
MIAAAKGGGSMPFQDHFSRLAQNYARSRPLYPSAIYQYLAGIAPGQGLAWDCATGNGQAAVALAEYFEQVAATDASAKQIEQAFPHPRVVYRVEPAETTSLAPGTVDLVTVGTAVHWFDFDGFYAEVQRVSRPGGILAVWTYFFPQIDPDVDALIDHLYWKVLNGYWPERIRYLENKYQTLPFPFAEIEPPPFVMEADWSLKQLLGFIASWSGTQKYQEQTGRQPIEVIMPDLGAAWGPEEQVRHIRWPLYFRIGRLPGPKR